MIIQIMQRSARLWIMVTNRGTRSGSQGAVGERREGRKGAMNRGNRKLRNRGRNDGSCGSAMSREHRQARQWCHASTCATASSGQSGWPESLSAERRAPPDGCAVGLLWLTALGAHGIRNDLAHRPAVAPELRRAARALTPLAAVNPGVTTAGQRTASQGPGRRRICRRAPDHA